MRVFVAFTILISLCAARAFADPPAIGANVNLMFGSFQGSLRQTATLPMLPIPAFALRVPAGPFVLRAEEVPPIGPVQYGDGFGGMQATKLSYLNAVLAWRSRNNRFEFGAGTSLLNQVTLYSAQQVTQQSSRVAGFRLSGRFRLESTPRAVTDLTIAASPSMHGLQNSRVQVRSGFTSVLDSELASLVDVAAQRTQVRGGFEFSYGVRYVNYVAHFSATGRPADHDVGVMPFVGFAFELKHK